MNNIYYNDLHDYILKIHPMSKYLYIDKMVSFRHRLGSRPLVNDVYDNYVYIVKHADDILKSSVIYCDGILINHVIIFTHSKYSNSFITGEGIEKYMELMIAYHNIDEIIKSAIFFYHNIFSDDLRYLNFNFQSIRRNYVSVNSSGKDLAFARDQTYSEYSYDKIKTLLLELNKSKYINIDLIINDIAPDLILFINFIVANKIINVTADDAVWEELHHGYSDHLTVLYYKDVNNNIIDNSNFNKIYAFLMYYTNMYGEIASIYLINSINKIFYNKN
jgi:hypothetical protein